MFSAWTIANISWSAVIIYLPLCLQLMGEMVATARTRGILRSYFLAQMGATISLWFGWRVWGFYADWYRILYCLATLCVLVPSFLLVYEAGARLWVFSLSALLSLPIGFWCLYDAPKHDADYWIVSTEAILLAWLGFAAGFRVHIEKNPALFILTLLWLMLCMYDASWIMVGRNEAVNALLPAYLISTASFAIAFHKPHLGLSQRI